MHAGTVSTKYDGKERVKHVKEWLSTTFDIMFFFQDNKYDFISGLVFDPKLFMIPTLLTVWFICTASMTVVCMASIFIYYSDLQIVSIKMTIRK